MILSELYKQAENQLISGGYQHAVAKQDCKDILLYVCKYSKTELLMKNKETVNESIIYSFNKCIQERLKGKPVQYITNNAVFFGYNFFVNENCLIPRIDSEILVENAIALLKHVCVKKNIAVLDLCSGSGCLGISFLKYIKDNNLFNNNEFQLTMIDKSSPAMQVAKFNCAKFNLTSRYIISDILTNGLGNEKYDVILCNPPYIETNTIPQLDREVKYFEPHLALDGGNDGLKFYRFLSQHIKQNLHSNALLILEIGYNQAKAVTELFTNNNFHIQIVKDYGKQDRCLIVQI